MNKKAFLIFAAGVALFTATAKAEDEQYALLYPAETEITVDQGDTFSLVLNLDNTIIPSSFQFFLAPPEGITVAKNKLKFDVTYTERLDPEVYALNALQVKDTNDVVILNYNNLEYNNAEAEEYKIQPGTGPFATVKFAVSADMEPGTYDLRIYDILFVTLTEEEYRSPEAIVKVKVRDRLTGIQSPATDTPGQPEVYYTLTGQRATHITPGIYIVNGKKVLVK